MIQRLPPYAPALLVVSTGGNMTAADVQHKHEWSHLFCSAASTSSLHIPYLQPLYATYTVGWQHGFSRPRGRGISCKPETLRLLSLQQPCKSNCIAASLWAKHWWWWWCCSRHSEADNDGTKTLCFQMWPPRPHWHPPVHTINVPLVFVECSDECCWIFFTLAVTVFMLDFI